MKGPITGQGYAQVAGVTAAAMCLKPSVTARGYGMRGVGAVATGIVSSVVVKGTGLRSLLFGTAFETSDRNIVNVRKYLVVTPETPQSLMWVVPGNEISYLVESNTDWNVT